MKYLAFLLLSFSFFIPGTSFAAIAAECEQSGIGSYIGLGSSTIRCSCPGDPGIYFEEFTYDQEITTADQCKVACNVKNTINSDLGIQGYSVQCIVAGKTAEIERGNFSGGSLDYTITDCKRSGYSGIAGDFSAAVIDCSCPSLINKRDYIAKFHRKAENVNECRTNCLFQYKEAVATDYAGRTEAVVESYEASCEAFDNSGVWDGYIITLGQETFSEDSVADASHTECISEKECLCPTTIASSYGLPTALAQAGLQTTDTNTCEDNCNIFINNNPTVTFTNQWQLRCEVAEGPLIASKNYVISDSGDIDLSIKVKKKCGDSFIAPQLGIQFPGFTPSTDNFSCERDYVSSSLLGLYVSAVYRWLLGAGSLIAVVMIMIGGVQWMMARGNSTGISKAKNTIGNAMFGLALLFFAYTIAYWINPAHVQFSTLKIEYLNESDDLPFEGEHDLTNDGDPSSTAVEALGEDQVVLSDPNISVVTSDNRFIEPVATRLKLVAAELKKEMGVKLKVTSGIRTSTKQGTLYYDNCIAGNRTSCDVPTCNIIARNKRGDIVQRARTENWSQDRFLNTAIPLADPNNCPHTAFAAVDAWCVDGNFKGFRFTTECQAALTRIFQKNGFCRLETEPWHFELDSIKRSTRSCKLNQDEWSYRQSGTPNKKKNIPLIIHNFQNCKRWSIKGNAKSKVGSHVCEIF